MPAYGCMSASYGGSERAVLDTLQSADMVEFLTDPVVRIQEEANSAYRYFPSGVIHRLGRGLIRVTSSLMRKRRRPYRPSEARLSPFARRAKTGPPEFGLMGRRWIITPSFAIGDGSSAKRTQRKNGRVPRATRPGYGRTLTPTVVIERMFAHGACLGAPRIRMGRDGYAD